MQGLLLWVGGGVRRQRGFLSKAGFGCGGIGEGAQDDILWMVLWQRDAEDKTDTTETHTIDVSLLGPSKKKKM